MDNPDTSGWIPLQIENTKIKVPTQILAAYSSFFRAMFKYESNKLCFDLPQEDIENFKCFLQCLIPSSGSGLVAKVDGTNVEVVMKLSDRYCVPHLRAKCTKFLLKNWAIDSNIENVHRSLAIACEYECNQLLEMVMSKAFLNPPEYGSPYLRHIPSQIMAQLWHQQHNYMCHGSGLIEIIKYDPNPTKCAVCASILFDRTNQYIIKYVVYFCTHCETYICEGCMSPDRNRWLGSNCRMLEIVAIGANSSVKCCGCDKALYSFLGSWEKAFIANDRVLWCSSCNKYCCQFESCRRLHYDCPVISEVEKVQGSQTSKPMSDDTGKAQTFTSKEVRIGAANRSKLAILLVETSQVFTSIDLLTSNCDFFRSLFQNQHNEVELELSGENLTDLITFLKFLEDPINLKIHDEVVEKVMKLAIRYGASSLLNKCVEFLVMNWCGNSDVNIVHKALSIGCKFKNEVVINACIPMAILSPPEPDSVYLNDIPSEMYAYLMKLKKIRKLQGCGLVAIFETVPPENVLKCSVCSIVLFDKVGQRVSTEQCPLFCTHCHSYRCNRCNRRDVNRWIGRCRWKEVAGLRKNGTAIKCGGCSVTLISVVNGGNSHLVQHKIVWCSSCDIYFCADSTCSATHLECPVVPSCGE